MGKRPDQFQIDPGEGGATDYKNLPQTGRGHSAADDTAELDRQQLARSRKEAKGQPHPPDVPAPGIDVKRGTKISQKQAEDEENGEQGEEENP
jgi:hypothetical protein